MMKLFVPALGLVLVAGAAQAALAPQYYQNARDTAANVVVLKITRVTPPQSDQGECKVAGKVRQIERGTLYKARQAIVVQVPCMTPGALVPTGPTIWQWTTELKRGAQARAWINADGSLAQDQFQILN